MTNSRAGSRFAIDAIAAPRLVRDEPDIGDRVSRADVWKVAEQFDWDDPFIATALHSAVRALGEE